MIIMLFIAQRRPSGRAKLVIRPTVDVKAREAYFSGLACRVFYFDSLSPHVSLLCWNTSIARKRLLFKSTVEQGSLGQITRGVVDVRPDWISALIQVTTDE